MITKHWPITKATAEALSSTADLVLVAAGGRYLCHGAVLSLDSPHLATLASLELQGEGGLPQGGALPELRLSADTLPPSCRELDQEAWTAFLRCLYGASSDYQVGAAAAAPHQCQRMARTVPLLKCELRPPLLTQARPCASCCPLAAHMLGFCCRPHSRHAPDRAGCAQSCQCLRA